MASKKAPEPEDLETEEGEGDESQEVEKLESELKEMSEKILHYRATLPDKLKDTFVSLLTAQRPILPEASEPGTSGDQNPGTVFFFSFSLLLLVRVLSWFYLHVSQIHLLNSILFLGFFCLIKFLLYWGMDYLFIFGE